MAAMTGSEWVADGTPSATPVTTATPEPTPAAPVTAPDSAAPASTGPARGADGKFTASAASAGSSGTAAASGSAAGTGTGSTDVPATPAIEYLAAQLDGKPYQLPKGVQLPWKRGAEQGYASIDEIQRAHMFERDYRAKTSAHAERERQFTLNEKLAEARLKAREDYLKEQQTESQKAIMSPEEMVKWEATQEVIRSNPTLQKMMNDALTGRISQAESAARQEYDAHVELVDETQKVADAIVRIGNQNYPGIDPERIRMRYATELAAGTMPVSTEAIGYLYRQEAEFVQKATAPVQEQLKQMADKIAAFEAANAAATHNANTAAKIKDTLHPVGTPSGGNAPSGAATPKQFKGKTLHERGAEWARAG